MIAGLVCGAQLNGRINERNSVLTRSEPFAYAAQNLYAALSAADAAAGSAFLSGGIETGPMRAQYQQALARASSALADATAGTTDIQTRTSPLNTVTATPSGWWEMGDGSRVQTDEVERIYAEQKRQLRDRRT